MARKTEDVIDAYQRLHEYACPPHFMFQLSSVLEGQRELTSQMLSQMVDHLRGCDYCQLAVEIMAAASLIESARSVSAEAVEDLRRRLERLKTINLTIQKRDERIAEYAELVEKFGEKEARKRYPDFAEHLKHCPACTEEVEDTRQALREAISAGLIPPFEITTKRKGK